MNKFHVLVIVIFGFLLMPSSAFACGNNSEKHSCKKEVSSKSDKDDCCKDDSHSKNKNHEGCGGKCNHSKCACASSSNTSISISEWNINNNIFNFSSEKQKFYNYETSISSGFNSLWLIPKIG
ncbi:MULTISPECIES: hypothetical protein [Flavobacterium]|uniref:Lipoprotein n=1 Tax=Flavobacterium gawalongense TaxID=2594432 RepID=A0ABY3CPZ5_9FLAO|nr:hypothetical protein [Flavobacterium gawalongense]TRW99012.1 hypothetical protein FNW33_15160 [Flavobacterium gawalongense]TRX09923.1 hypothetical protein FNW12_02065 [Flavobacterium gawalongense]